MLLNRVEERECVTEQDGGESVTEQGGEERALLNRAYQCPAPPVELDRESNP